MKETVSPRATLETLDGERSRVVGSLDFSTVAHLLRIGDAAGGWRFRYSQWVDKAIMLLRGHAWVNTYCRSVPEWLALLRECGFEARTMPMSQGTPFANVLLLAHAA